MSQDKPQEQTSGIASFFGAIKGAIFEEDSAEKTSAKATSVKPAPTNIAEQAIATVSVKKESFSAVPGVMTSPMAADMMNLVMSKTTAYTALMESVSSLEQYVPDEASRFKAAFGIVGKTRSLEQIVQSIDMQHLPALDAEAQRFSLMSRDQEAQEITSREAEVERLHAAIKMALEEMAAIRKKMEDRVNELQGVVNDASAKITAVQSELTEKKSQIALVKVEFSAAIESVKTSLVEAKAKVLRYLSA